MSLNMAHQAAPLKSQCTLISVTRSGTQIVLFCSAEHSNAQPYMQIWAMESKELYNTSGMQEKAQPTTVGNPYTDQYIGIACVLQSCQPVMSVCDPEPRYTCWRCGYSPLCHDLPIPGAYISILRHFVHFIGPAPVCVDRKRPVMRRAGLFRALQGSMAVSLLQM